MILPPDQFAIAWQVFLLFLIPVGGGIPAGVVLAQSKGLSWTMLAALYFFSDVALAFMFEPLILIFLWRSRTSPRFAKWAESYKAALAKLGFKYGISAGPWSLLAISFGVDPMTGRVATRAAGYGFLSGWGISICGDMLYFAVIMASTLWLNNVLGNGTLATVIVMFGMLLAPSLIKKFSTPTQE